MFQVLIVEDDAGIRAVLRTLFTAEGYRIIEAETAERAVLEARSHRPDVMLVDLGLPDRHGLVVIRAVREFSPVPIVVLSARAMETDKIAALDAGADDYVTKPFGSHELLARVRAVLRRHVRAAEPSAVLQIGNLRVDLAHRETQGPAGPLHLTPLEFRLLECLARNAGLNVTQENLIREVWGPDRIHDTRGLRVYIKMLRQKLEPDPHQPRYLLTETGVGYRLKLE